MNPAFAKLSKLNQKFILETMLGPSPIGTMSTRGDVTSKGATLDVVSMEAPAPVPVVPRSPRLKPTPIRETQKLKKDKQKSLVPVCDSPIKHSRTLK